MNLDFFNDMKNNLKENNLIKKFLEELSNCLERKNMDNTLKQEDCLYQVVEIGTDGAFLQNMETNKISKEYDIPKELLKIIGNDSILRYKNGIYIYEEELTDKFFNGLIDINEFKNN